MMQEQKLQELLDKQAITEVLYQYARAWDRRDEALLYSCFHTDATHTHGRHDGAAIDFIRMGLVATAQVASISHLLSNPLIVVKGDRALAECSYLAHHRRPDGQGGEEDYFAKGRYLDKFARRQGRWRILHRQGLRDFERIVTPAAMSVTTLPDDRRGQFKPDDPLYALLRDFGL